MFGAVIIHIVSSRIPIVTELILIIPEADPVEVYFHSFGLFWSDGIFCGPRGGQVVHLEV